MSDANHKKAFHRAERRGRQRHRRAGRRPNERERMSQTPYKISLKIRSQLPRRIFSISSSEKPRSINLRVRLRV